MSHAPQDGADRARVTITPYPDGPLLVRGAVEILGVDGTAVPLRRRTVALCRCGLSALKPFCDGSHREAGFRTGDGPGPAASGPDEGSDRAPGPAGPATA
jgi:CDGSH-type Zn-finger protein